MRSIKSWAVFSFLFSHVYGADLVDVQCVLPNIEVELKYATDDNFTGQVVYDFDDCYLLECVVDALSEVAQEFESMGLKLKIWDGYRPTEAQWKFWELVPDERYVSDPRKGGRHTRGTAVDLTLITESGEELLMPSAFDDFSEKAHRSYRDAPEEALKNRDLLQTVMEKHGFIGLPTEWWHFDYVGWENFPPIVEE